MAEQQQSTGPQIAPIESAQLQQLMGWFQQQLEEQRQRFETTIQAISN